LPYHLAVISSLDPRPRGVLFDYGNTLIPFGQREMDAEGKALIDALAEARPAVKRGDIEIAFHEVRLVKFRHRRETLRETRADDVLRETAIALGGSLTEEQVARAIAAHRDVFVSVAVAAPAVHEVLTRLREDGFALGLVSNFSHGEAIHASLDHLDLRRFFDVVIVSADLGIVKPHPDIFLAGAAGLDLPPEDILFVGDNARLDIAGAQGVGMRTALITEHLERAYHFERPGEDRIDVTPDLTLARLTDLITKD
jgi:putative hydrolase of the HAD superfamily